MFYYDVLLCFTMFYWEDEGFRPRTISPAYIMHPNTKSGETHPTCPARVIGIEFRPSLLYTLMVSVWIWELLRLEPGTLRARRLSQKKPDICRWSMSPCVGPEKKEIAKISASLIATQRNWPNPFSLPLHYASLCHFWKSSSGSSAVHSSSPFFHRSTLKIRDPQPRVFLRIGHSKTNCVGDVSGLLWSPQFQVFLKEIRRLVAPKIDLWPELRASANLLLNLGCRFWQSGNVAAKRRLRGTPKKLMVDPVGGHWRSLPNLGLRETAFKRPLVAVLLWESSRGYILQSYTAGVVNPETRNSGRNVPVLLPETNIAENFAAK